MENKNTILALILMLLVWTGFTVLFPPQEESNISSTQVLEPVSEPEAKGVINNSFPLNNGKTSTASSGKMSSDVFNSRSEDNFIDFSNNLYAIQFNLRGGSVSVVKLLGYLQENTPNSPPVALLDKKHDISTLGVFSGNNFGLIGDEVYTFKKYSNNDEQIVKLSTALDNGVLLSKTFTFFPDSYLVNVNIEVENRSETSLADVLQITLNNFWDEALAGNRFDYIGFTSYIDEKLHEDEVEEIQGEKKTYTGGISWSGFTDKYFLSALVDRSDKFESVTLERFGRRISNTARTANFNIASGEKKSVDFAVYFGPKNIDYLTSAGKNLAEVVDFGFFAFLSKPLHVCLKFFYTFVHNYGAAIVLLTVIIKLLFWPLTQKSYVSMKAMQTLQPEMKKLREKFRGDKEGLNRSMMELYKEHRVNPLGGCLPMLVQIPVFIALYKVLLGTIELRHAPFALWLTDLSVKDPYYITPIIMGATMFIQQKMTPSTMDPMQAKMMLAMPVVFTFIFLNFPSGLVLYWLVNNLLTILQQYLIYRKPSISIS